MRRTNPLFEADGTTASTTREGDDEATRRLRAGGTLAAAREFATDGSARGSGGRCVFAKVDANGASVRWGEVRGAADEARLTRMCAFKNVSRVERRGDGLVVRLIKRDGDVVELTGQTVAQAAMWERGLAIVVREYAESAGANQALEAVDDDDAESNLDDTDDDDDVGGARLERGRANSTSQARAFVPEPSTPTRAGAVGANDGHVMISVSPEASPSSRRGSSRRPRRAEFRRRRKSDE